MQRISLANQAFEGKNNVYLLNHKSGTTLIDTGDGRDETYEQLETKLAEYDVLLSDIDQIFLTHWHGDHSGNASRIQEESGATIYVHNLDAPLVENNERAYEKMYADQRDLFRKWGMPKEKRDVLVSRFHSIPDGIAPDVKPFSGGDMFEIGDQTLTAIHTPGHTAGLSCFSLARDGRTEIFSGDTLLPVYTPNVGGADVRVERPLERYLDSLLEIRDGEYEISWPGHRTPINEPAGRANKIFHHHEERAWRILDVVQRCGPSTPWEISAVLFGELEGIHIKHGPGEVYAHLDHLERNGDIESSNGTYRLSETTDVRIEDGNRERRWSLV